MVRSAVRWLVRLALLGLALAALAAMATGPGQALGAVLAWAFLAYLVWRAWPAVRRDLGRLHALRPARGAYGVGSLRREDRTL